MNDRILYLPEAPTERHYLIVYIDILGTKERLAQKDSSEVFEKVYYQFLLAGKVAPIMKKLNLMDIEVKIFSDNILFAYPIDNYYDREEILEAYTKLGKFLKLFLSMFINNGVLFRGSITVDRLFINELMVWGKGLVSVVDLEENVAIYPRVILSEDLLMIFDQFGVSGFEYEEKFSCLIDADDCVFFDLFDYYDKDIGSL